MPTRPRLGLGIGTLRGCLLNQPDVMRITWTRQRGLHGARIADREATRMAATVRTLLVHRVTVAIKMFRRARASRRQVA